MVLIELFTGSKRSQSRRTAPSRVKCGRSPVGILVTGETIAKKVSVFNSTKMVISTKVCGLSTRSTARVTTGEMKMVN